MKDIRLKQVVGAFAFLRSVILSGEPMTEDVRTVINEAINHVKDVDEDYFKNTTKDGVMQEKLKAGDTIVFDRTMSKYVEVGKEYKVLYVSHSDTCIGIRIESFEIMLENNKTKRMGFYTQGYFWRIANSI